MGFFSPLFLAGLLGVGLPIWLHLLRRHKTEPKPFASLMFFEKRTQSSVKHRRLLYRLLMLFRLLMMLLLALLFAEPYFRQSVAPTGNRLLVAVVDHTFSMRAGNSLARAKGEIESVLTKRAASEEAQVLALGSNIEVITQPTTDGESLKNAVAGIAAGDGRASYGDLARYLPDGSLVFLGRSDQRLKIGGIRIEPAEIEAALRALPAVDEVVVLAQEEISGEMVLTACSLHNHQGRHTAGIRTFCGRGRAIDASLNRILKRL